MWLLKAVAVLSILLIIAAILLNGRSCSSQPVRDTPATIPSASQHSASQPAYPLWDGKDTVAAYAKRAGIKETELILNLDGNTVLKLTLIPAGKFLMGSPAGEKDRSADEGPQREVTISRPFYMGVYEVTRGQFAQFISDSGYKSESEKDSERWGWNGTKFVEIADPSWRKTGFEQTEDHPVVNVSWRDAAAFCEWASKKRGKKVSLPTEAQWEYACRAGTQTAYPWGDDPNDGKGWANGSDQTLRKAHGGNRADFTWDDGYAFTAPVGKFKPNAFGLYDMVGNVWEWCADRYGEKDYAKASKSDPTGPASGTHRILRGGCWHCAPGSCRSACRNGDTPGVRCDSVGFRIAVDLK